MSNKLAHYFLKLGYGRGDSVAIFMENDPKFMVVLLALSKIGVAAALINSNLTDNGLVHSINIAKCRGCVYHHNLEGEVAKVAANLVCPPEKAPFQLFCTNNASKVPHEIGEVVDLEEAFRGFPETAIPR